jgi:uroporphyrinogen-III synthase
MTGRTGESSADGPRQGDPLAGWLVVVTGDARRSSTLGQQVSARGADVVRLPVVAIEDPVDEGAALEAAIDRLLSGDYAWVMVTSANAVDRVRRSLAGRRVPEVVRWAAVGPSTGRALEEAGLPCHLVAPAATADALAEVFVGSATAGRVLYPRAERVRSDLGARLIAAGWPVDEVVAYRTTAADPDPSAREAARRADAVLFTSGSAVEAAVALIGRQDVPPIVVTIGPATSAAARDAGLEVAAEAEPHSTDGLVDALVMLARSGTRSPDPMDEELGRRTGL